jgi:hypothetical protein
MSDPPAGRPAEIAILDAFPDEQDRPLRICLLRIHHAAESAEWRLGSLGVAMVDMVADPSPDVSGPLLEAASEDLAVKLRALAGELDKSAATLRRLARERWARITPATPPDQDEAPF